MSKSNKDFMLSFDFSYDMPINGTVTNMTCGAVRRAGANNLFAVATPYSIYKLVDGEYVPYSYDDFIHKLTGCKYYQLRMVKGVGSRRDVIDPELIKKAEETGKGIADFNICFNIREELIFVDGNPVDLETLELSELEELFAADVRPYGGMKVYFNDLTLPETGKQYAGRTIYQLGLDDLHIELCDRASKDRLGNNRIKDLLSDCEVVKFDPCNLREVDVAVMKNLYAGQRPVNSTPRMTAADILRNRTQNSQSFTGENAPGGIEM